jgi:trehalose-phosphatase
MLYTHPKLDLAAFFLRVARARQTALLLDYDGTLAPFRRERDLAVPYPGLTPLLQAIIDAGGTRVVVITGRRAHEVVPLLHVSPAPEVWGTHGLERLHNDGRYEQPDIDPHTQEGLTEAEQWVDRLGLRQTIERKPGSLAVHWRGFEARTAQEIFDKVALGWLDIADRACLTLEQFDGGVEIRLADRNKGDAVRTILTEMEIDAPVAYFGDDQTDEDAFRALRDRGLGILVRPHWRESAANIWLRPPVQLYAFLHDWWEARQCASLESTRPFWGLEHAAAATSDQGHGQHPQR